MKSKSMLSILGSLALTGTLIFSPYSMNFDKENVKKSTVSASQIHNRNILFVAEENLNSSISMIKKEEHEENKAMKGAKDNLNKGNMTVTIKNKNSLELDFNSYEDIAFNIEDVKQDKALQAKLRNSFKQGTKVYLYGGVTIDEYKEILNIDKVSFKKGNLTLEVGTNNTETKEKGKLKDNPDSLAQPDEDRYSIIGYSNDTRKPYKLVISNISSYNEDGHETQVTTEQQLLEILDSSSDTIDLEGSLDTFSLSSNNSGFLKENKANADSVIVDSAETRITGSAYYGSTRVGHTVTDWILEKAPDNDSDFDFFDIMDKTSIYVDASAWDAWKLITDHDIPYSSDYIIDWDPGDDTSSPYTIGLAAPFNVSFQFDMDSDPRVNDIGSQEDDYGRWRVLNGLWSDLDGERFEPATSWKSTGTYAAIDLREKGYFERSVLDAESSVLINVRYNY